MKLYLSQKALLCLFLGGFLVGVAAAFLYVLSELFHLYRPRSAFGRVLRYLSVSLRDFLLFTAVGVADAILFFVYHSGRVRATVFVLNLLGFCLCYYGVLQPLVIRLKRWFGKFFKKRNEDVL